MQLKHEKIIVEADTLDRRQLKRFYVMLNIRWQ